MSLCSCWCRLCNNDGRILVDVGVKPPPSTVPLSDTMRPWQEMERIVVIRVVIVVEEELTDAPDCGEEINGEPEPEPRRSEGP